MELNQNCIVMRQIVRFKNIRNNELDSESTASPAGKEMSSEMQKRIITLAALRTLGC